MNAFYIGIDTGTHTGLAIWDGALRRFVSIETLPLYEAIFTVQKCVEDAKRTGRRVMVIFEDARQRKWIPAERNNSEYRGKLMGAGAVKRDAAIWEEYLTGCKIPFEKRAPAKGLTKLSPDRFETLTGWTGRTSNHARDAALLVFGR